MLIRRNISTPSAGWRKRARIRRGTVVSLLAVTMVGLLGFLALAIDIGMMAIAKTQAQNAADLAALAACRTLNGNSSNNYNNAAATTNAQNILNANKILGQSITASSALTMTFGSYDYNQSTQTFSANFPPTSGVPWTAVAATVSTTTTMQTAFGGVFGSQYLTTMSATAQAVHRPRDIALVMDLSASMRFGTLLGYDFYTSTRTTNNADTLVPTFAQYSAASSSLIGPSGTRTSGSDNYTIPNTNSTATTASYSLTYINSFYQNAAYASTLIRAFDSYTSTDGGNTWTAPVASATPQLPSATFATTPGGDVPLFQNGSTTSYAQTLNSALGDTSSNTVANILWEVDGYSAYVAGQPDVSATGSTPHVWWQTDFSAPSGSAAGTYTATASTGGSLPFNGYTKGPGYYGKTFFLWPPDPRTTTSPTGSVLFNFLNDLGVTASDATAISGSTISASTTAASVPWTVWQSQGATGLSNLQTWLKGGATLSQCGATGSSKASTGTVTYYPATLTSGPITPATASNCARVPSSTSATSDAWSGSWKGNTVSSSYLPPTYNAVCRLFNRAYPGGTAWTSTSFSADWRMRFFGTTNDNTVIFNSSGSINPPGTTGMWPSAASSSAAALLTYNAILTWLTTTTDPFPSQMRSGRIKYYSAIPAPSGTFTGVSGSWPSYGSTDQRFWVEVIDHILGFRQTASASYLDLTGITATYQMTGYGNDFNWGTVSISSVPTATSGNIPAYMNYQDNPARPLLRLWFSPLLMVDYLQNCNMYENNGSYGASLNMNFFFMQPGNSYEAPLYVAKQAYASAITTMQNNHPNDWFTMLNYSQPRATATDSAGRFNCVSCPLGTNYTYAQSSLLFPFSTITSTGATNSTEVTPYDADAATASIPSSNFVDTPRSGGDTCFAMGLMLAFNQFAVTATSDSTLRSYVATTPINFPSAMAGGMGRKGAQKVVIFETDGMANCQATATLVATASYSYYKIRYDMNNPTTSEYPSVNPTSINDAATLSQVYSLVTQLQTSYGTTRNPFRLYAIGFGPVFAGPDASSALSTLQTMQYYAGTQTSATTSLSSSQIITGTDTQMSANMISAYTTILESGVQIALIK